MSEISKKYNPKESEGEIYKKWEASDAFKPNRGEPFKREKQKPFVIMLPLPNVTGSLHMGHALQHSIMDVLIRYHRMKGEPTLWQFGTDHAGIATQNVVEKELRKEGISRHDLGREKFIAKVWEWREEYGNQIVGQMKRMGSSCDWSRAVFTMDDDYVNAVQEAFIQYYEKGYIYRGNRIVNWCPRCASVISDLEVNHVEKEGKLYRLRYPLADGEGMIEVATTRPETMLGDTGVAVHPDDARYKKLVGKSVMLPLMNREIPVVADERVDKQFGTGAVKVTPAHDPLDAEIGETHHLEAINVIGEDGKMTRKAGNFVGLKTREAREAVVSALEKIESIADTKNYIHQVTECDRCKTVIEPLVSRQWFVDMSKLSAETIEVAEEEIIQFFPKRWKKNFIDWMENVHDWTISRQLWWGQQIPVWWKEGKHGTNEEDGNFVVSLKKPTGDNWVQDPDVFDTWFSSALWPIATLGWPEYTEDIKRFYPTSVLISARDILYLWIARMIFSGLDLMGGEKFGNRGVRQRIPYEHVFLHPTVLTKTGQRMSKSLGTGIDPLELMDQYGADATRFGLLYQMSYDNQAIKFDEKAAKSARNFANKVWNIARLLESLPKREETTMADEWIQDRLREVSNKVSKYLEQYKVGEAAREIYKFIWHDYADWYAEIVKIKGSTKVATEVFKGLLILLHPFMPFVTEKLWTSEKEMLINSWWVEERKKKSSAKAAEMMTRLQDVTGNIRSIKALIGVSSMTSMEVYLDKEIQLPEVLASIAKVNVVDKEEDYMKRVPLKSGGWLFIGSRDIDEKQLVKAFNKLNLEKEELERFIKKQDKIIKMMEGKASRSAIADKKEGVAGAHKRMKEIINSLKFLEQ